MWTTFFRRPLALLSLFFLICAFIYVEVRGYPYVDILEVIGESSSITVKGYVRDKNIKEDKYILMLDRVTVEGSQGISLWHKDKKEKNIAKNIGVICYLDEESISSYEDFPEMGAYVEVSGKASAFNVPTNPGEFDMRQFYATKGYYFAMFSSRVEAKSKGYDKYREALYDIDRKIVQAYDLAFDSIDAGILKAMILGDRGELSSDIKSLFQNGGISHIISISGLHVSIIGLGLYKLLRAMRMPKGISMILASGIMISYYYLTGRSPSTFRAVSMFVIMLGAVTIGRTYDIITSISVAAVILVLGNPWLLMYAGFWLSFMAVLGIAVFASAMCISEEVFIVPYWIGKRNKIRILRCINGVISGVSISFFTLPIVLYYYYEFPLYSILINLLVIPLMTILLGLAIVAGILGCFGFVFVARIVGYPCRFILWIYEKVCLLVGKLPGNHLVFGKPSAVTIVIFYLIVLFIICLYQTEKHIRKVRETSRRIGNVRSDKHKRAINNTDSAKGNYKRDIRSILSDCINAAIRHRLIINLGLVIVSILLVIPRKQGFNLVMMDVGQGDGILLYGANYAYMIDGGSSSSNKVGEYKIEPCIKSLGIKTIDYWFVSHPDMDHTSGLIEILSDENTLGLDIKNIVLPGSSSIEEDAAEIISLASDRGINICTISEGMNIEVGGLGDKKTKIICLGPDSDKDYGDDVNSYSEILYANYGELDMLFTGDATVESEQEYIAYAKEHGIKITDIDVLKVSHHGSNTSSSDMAIDILKPRISLISCGQNNRYGHPHDEVVARLEDSGSRIYRTDMYGAIIIRAKKDKISIKTWNTYVN